MASAQLVELMVSVLQHPEGAHAPAPKIHKDKQSTDEQQKGRIEYDRDEGHPLGIVPHSIRGFMANFQNLPISGQPYDCCSACSPKVVDEYKRLGWEFVKKALIEKDYVTELSGLAEVQRAAEAAIAEMGFDSEGSVDDDDDGEMI